MRKLILASAVLVLGWVQVSAQSLPITHEYIPDGVTEYRPDIPKPEDVFGHVVGERHTRPDQVVRYFEAVDAISDRVKLYQHGWTYENRELIHAIVTSPANHARLDEIRRKNQALADNPGSITTADLESMPVVVYQGFSVHGNEASGTEAALVYLYYLAAAKGVTIDRLLENAVLIVDPMFNPDGRDRFVDWVNRNRGKTSVSDPQDMEHSEPWPGGRTNHYYFDLNRDWLGAQLKESAARMKVFHDWRPQLLTDHHEMGGSSTFFFQPGIPSRNNPNTPENVFALTSELATYHAAELDKIGSGYYSEESFDDYYYGKGSAFPDAHGAVGILFEQASSRALKTEVDDGVLHYGFTVRNQLAAAISTLRGAVSMRTKFVGHMKSFYEGAPGFAANEPVKGYVLDGKADPIKAQLLLQNLQTHRIEVHQLAKDFVDGTTRITADGGYFVSVNQPQARFIKSVMERVTTFTDSLFYDVSTWTLPYAYGVPYAEVRQDPRPFMGNRLGPVELTGGSLSGAEPAYAWLMEWGTYYAPRALAKILKAGIHPGVAMEPFSISVNGEIKTFPRGTIMIPVTPRDGNPHIHGERVSALMKQIVSEDYVNVHAVQTGLTPTGPDLGSRTFRLLDQPRIGLLAGSGISSNDMGELWFLLTERFGMEVSLLDAGDLNRLDLSRYNTIITVSGLSNSATEAIKPWVSGGGLLIATESAANWAVRSELLKSKVRESDYKMPLVPYADVSNTRGAQVIAGTIFESTLDTTHPLTFGYPERIATFRTSSTFFEPSETAGVTVGKYTDDPLLSGYVSDERLAEIAGSASILASRSGRGAVVLLADNPNFRAFWFGTNGLFLNAVFFGRSF